MPQACTHNKYSISTAESFQGQNLSNYQSSFTSVNTAILFCQCHVLHSSQMLAALIFTLEIKHDNFLKLYIINTVKLFSCSYAENIEGSKELDVSGQCRISGCYSDAMKTLTFRRKWLTTVIWKIFVLKIFRVLNDRVKKFTQSKGNYEN